jgi:imidazole glycerol-phosphate synthase subunit HisH
MTARVAIVDYGVGNLFSVKQACAHVGISAELARSEQDIAAADAIILPGVGAFGYAMDRLRDYQLLTAVKDSALSGKPFMGICLGFQLMFDGSDEIGSHEGLGLVKGSVRPLSAREGSYSSPKFRTPVVSWLPISARDGGTWEGSLLEKLQPHSEMYFVHSFAANPVDRSDILAETTCQDITYCCAIERGNLFGCQFHPEKSGLTGLEIYRSFARRIAAR